MNKLLPVAAIFVCLLSTVIAGQMESMQESSKLRLGISFHVPRLLVFSLDYYATERTFWQISIGGAPHFVNFGASFNYLFDAEKPRSFARVALTHYTFGAAWPRSQVSTDKPMVRDGSFSVIDLGFGHQFRARKNSWFVAGGPGYVFRQQKTFVNRSGQTVTRKTDDYKWFGFFELGGYYRN